MIEGRNILLSKMDLVPTRVYKFNGAKEQSHKCSRQGSEQSDHSTGTHFIKEVGKYRFEQYLPRATWPVSES